MLTTGIVSGYPEWLPEGQIVQREFLATLTRVFELYGYAPLTTRAIEPLTVLTGEKGDTAKEIFTVSRLQNETATPTDGLRFDLTMPLARYISENKGSLTFPYRRYQIAPVWRGERPQAGRFKEFIQADIDIVGSNSVLPVGAETEIPLIIADVFRLLPVPAIRMRVSNRKILEGFFRGLGLEPRTEFFRIIDKRDKIGIENVARLLVDAGMQGNQARLCLQLVTLTGTGEELAAAVRSLGVENDMLMTGVGEVLALVAEINAVESEEIAVADFSIARGLDYYTGMVYETNFVGYESYGSICSGGAYDSLIAGGQYPGVGMSIGVTRILAFLTGEGMITVTRSTPTCVLVAVTSEETRNDSIRVARLLRARGIPTEVSSDAAKFGKQIRYADRRGIPYVWFPDSGEVKDIRAGEQGEADATSWMPPVEDLTPTVSRQERQ